VRCVKEYTKTEGKRVFCVSLLISADSNVCGLTDILFTVKMLFFKVSSKLNITPITALLSGLLAQH